MSLATRSAYSEGMDRLPVGEVLAQVLDPASWRPWDPPAAEGKTDPDYTAELQQAAATASSDEAIITGSGRVLDLPVAVIAADFDFLAGSVGRVAAARIASATDRATALGLPLLALPTSGGTRMQEGTPAFLLMAGIAAAVRRHVDTGLPYLVYLRHPTTGGVLATWGSLGDLTFAQPGALVGFLGPRVYQGLYGEPFPEGVQTAAGLTAAGVIDGVADPEQWRDHVADLLRAYRARPADAVESLSWEPAGADGGDRTRNRPAPVQRPADGWSAVSATRASQRPGLAELVSEITGFVPLSGTQAGETAAATIAGVGRLQDLGVVVVGFDRAAQADGQLVGPADLRVARRAMSLAQRWQLPLITVVDTQGGELSEAAERGALAGEIARCLADLSALRTPVLSVLLGGGGGGAALALVPGDFLLAAADAWITPLPPEGASLIRHRTTDRADEMANAQRITAADLHRVGAVDRIVAPPQDDVAAFVDEVAAALAGVVTQPLDLGARAAKWSAGDHWR